MHQCDILVGCEIGGVTLSQGASNVTFGTLLLIDLF